VKVGDGVFLYHSGSDPLAIAGTMEVVKAAYPDHTAFDKQEQHYDPKSKADAPTWFMVDVRLKQKFQPVVTRDMLKGAKELAKMVVLQQGSRLSIMPVTESEWGAVHKLARVKPE